MAQRTLVEQEIEDGERLLRRLRTEEIDWQDAFWGVKSETTRWVFYLVIPLAHEQGGRIGPLIAELRKYGFSIDPLEIKVIGPDDPIYKDVQSHRGLVVDQVYVYPKTEDLLRSLLFAVLALGYVLQGKPNPFQMQRSDKPRRPDRSFALQQLYHALKRLNMRVGIYGYTLEDRVSSLPFCDAPEWYQTALENVMKAEVQAMKNRPEADRDALHLLGEAMWAFRDNLAEKDWHFNDMAKIWPNRPVVQA